MIEPLRIDATVIYDDVVSDLGRVLARTDLSTDRRASAQILRDEAVDPRRRTSATAMNAACLLHEVKLEDAERQRAERRQQSSAFLPSYQTSSHVLTIEHGVVHLDEWSTPCTAHVDVEPRWHYAPWRGNTIRAHEPSCVTVELSLPHKSPIAMYLAESQRRAIDARVGCEVLFVHLSTPGVDDRPQPMVVAEWKARRDGDSWADALCTVKLVSVA